ncbi:hypothetical protein R1flu_000589 [Riccia fluitans]|uniref:Uncharacterized protein n=1 Tax=Riccia fluitans TaxID=41844 RepID=A0ABD1Y0V1_9MARC
MLAKICQAKLARADLVELRVDYITGFSPETDLPSFLDAGQNSTRHRHLRAHMGRTEAVCRRRSYSFPRSPSRSRLPRHRASMPRQEAAEGQPTLADLIDTYRIKKMNVDTEVYGIIGNPIGIARALTFIVQHLQDRGVIQFALMKWSQLAKDIGAVKYSGQEEESEVGTISSRQYSITHCDAVLSAIEDALLACGLESNGWEDIIVIG